MGSGEVRTADLLTRGQEPNQLGQTGRLATRSLDSRPGGPQIYMPVAHRYPCRPWLPLELGWRLWVCRFCSTCCWFSASALRRGSNRHLHRRHHRQRHRHRLPANRSAARIGARALTNTVVTTALLAQTLRLVPARVARQSKLARRFIMRYNARAARPPAARPPAPPPIALPTAPHRTTRPPPPAGRASGTSSTLAATATTTTGHGGRPKAMRAATTIPITPPARSSASSLCWL